MHFGVLSSILVSHHNKLWLKKRYKMKGLKAHKVRKRSKTQGRRAVMNLENDVPGVGRVTGSGIWCVYFEGSSRSEDNHPPPRPPSPT